jgi:trehalose 6-phosphate phosphatase
MTDRSELEQLLRPLRQNAGRSGIFLDFDGTIAETTLDPADGRPVPGMTSVLGRLAEVYRCVAVLSGRPMEFLVDCLPLADLTLVGAHGLEVSGPTGRWSHPAARAFIPTILELGREATLTLPPTVLIERKALAITLHHRDEPNAKEEVEAWCQRMATATGLMLAEGIGCCELRPDLGLDKGTALRSLSSGLQGACMFGDDRGDLSAFDALDELGRLGLNKVSIVVLGSSTPEEVRQRADLVVHGPSGALAALHRLLPSDDPSRADP